ncbi:MAG: Fur family transcriptional regulator [Candidatus Desantisbacteria bacterium]
MKDLQEKIERLKKKGVVLTIQRLAVLELLENACTHPTVDDIYKALKEKYPTISQATVYSTLELLRDAGEIQELSIHRDKACFDPNPKMHHHFFCRQCEKIIDIDIECPVSKQGEFNGNKVEEVQAYLYGVCVDCLKK